MLGRWVPIVLTIIGVAAFALVCVGAWRDTGWMMRGIVICSALCVAGAIGFSLSRNLGKGGAPHTKRPSPPLP